MKNRFLPIVGAAILLTIGTACSSSNTSDSSSEAQSQGPITVDTFTGLDVGTDVAVELAVEPGSKQKVEVEASSGAVTAEVSDEILTLGQTGDDGKAKITVPDINSIRLTDGTVMTAKGETDTYSLTMLSGTEARAKDLTAKTVTVDFTSGSVAEISASDTVTGSMNDGSELTVSGGADTSAVQLDDGSEIRTG